MSKTEKTEVNLMRNLLFIIAVALSFFSVQSVPAKAQSVPAKTSSDSVIRLIPVGCAEVLSGSSKGKKICSESPLPQDVLMTCQGQCVIQAQAIQLVAQDKSAFAFADGGQYWNLTVNKGRVDFALCSEKKAIAFFLPHFSKDQPPIIPPGNKGMVRGYVQVMAELDSTAHLVIQETSEDCDCAMGAWPSTTEGGLGVGAAVIPPAVLIPPIILSPPHKDRDETSPSGSVATP